MFTGIVEEIGRINWIKKGEKSAQINIGAKKVLEDVKLGDSISTNGVCLTVVDFSKDDFTVDVMAETMRKTNLNLLLKDDKVNLERALKVGDRFGGHIVSGHIDGTGNIVDYTREDNAIWISIEAKKEILKYIIEKGSIAIDGISLTVAYVDDHIFKVSIIPHTMKETTLVEEKALKLVNLECDILGKYVEKILNVTREEGNIDLEFLQKYGFA